jgi:hypothetical protein
VGIELSLDGLDGFAFGRGATSDELAALEESGFVIVPALLPEATVETLHAEFERLVAEDPRSRLHELGTRRSTATNDNDVFGVCWRHRVVLEAAAFVLGSTFQVGHVDLRDPNSGHGQQRLHPDHGLTPVPGVTATWFLDAFTADNGATRLLPGSHRSLPRSSEVTEAGLHTIPGSEMPVAGEVVALGPSGSLLVRDARLFHAAGRNTTRAPRRSALVFYQHDIPEPEYSTTR